MEERRARAEFWLRLSLSGNETEYGAVLRFEWKLFARTTEIQSRADLLTSSAALTFAAGD